MSIRERLTDQYLKLRIAYNTAWIRYNQWQIARKREELEEVNREIALAEWRQSTQEENNE